MRKGHTTISIDPDLVDIAKAMGINISRECENHLWGIVGFKNNPGYSTEKFKLQKMAEIKQRELEDFQGRIADMEQKEKEGLSKSDQEAIAEEKTWARQCFKSYEKTRAEYYNPHSAVDTRFPMLNSKLRKKISREQYMDLIKEVETERKNHGK
jgi:hypothetical protein